MNGEDIFKLGNQHIGERYTFDGIVVPKNDANWHGPWDCAEFTSWLVYQVSGKLYGCANDAGNPATADAYTGYWKDDAERLGRIITVAKAKAIPGAAILRCSSPAQKIGHVVISDGKGGTVEAHSTNTGVINSVVDGRRWDYGILVPWITYDETAAPIAYNGPGQVVYRLTQPMMVDAKVGEIQRALTAQGFDTHGIDDVFGKDTMNAVAAFQEAKNLVIDGEVGPTTVAALGINL